MTEFILSKNCQLGLMPNKGIAKDRHSDKTHHIQIKATEYQGVNYIYMLKTSNVNLTMQQK